MLEYGRHILSREGEVEMRRTAKLPGGCWLPKREVAEVQPEQPELVLLLQYIE